MGDFGSGEEDEDEELGRGRSSVVAFDVEIGRGSERPSRNGL